MHSPKKISVVVADAEPSSRHGLIALFTAHQRLRVEGEAATVRAASALCVARKPDILLIDPAMENGTGLRLVGDLRQWSRGTRAVAFARAADPVHVKHALEAGVRGYATRLDEEADVLKILLDLEDGKTHLSPRVLEALGDGLVNGRVTLTGDARAGLSQREREVFALLGAGRGTKLLANELNVSVKTVESHFERLKEKLHLRSMAELRRAAAVAALEESSQS